MSKKQKQTKQNKKQKLQITHHYICTSILRRKLYFQKTQTGQVGKQIGKLTAFADVDFSNFFFVAKGQSK